MSFSLVFGIRYNVGVDYCNYLEAYEQTAYYNSFAEYIHDLKFENGFSTILYLCHSIDAPAYVFFSLIAFIQILLIYNTFKREDNILIYIYLTMMLTGVCVYMFMNVLRQTIAFCFFLYSLHYIKENKLINYWIFCLFAVLFHHSAIILFPLYFVWIKRKSIFNVPKIELIIFLICVVGAFFTSWQEMIHSFDNIIVFFGYEDYINNAEDLTVNATFGIGKIISVILNALVITNSKQIKEYFQNDLFNILYDIYFVGVCLSNLFLTSMLVGRFILYFDLTRFILIAYALCYFYNTRKQTITQLVKYAICCSCIIVTYAAFIGNCENNTGAYVTWFQTDLHIIKDNQRDAMFE